MPILERYDETRGCTFFKMSESLPTKRFGKPWPLMPRRKESQAEGHLADNVLVCHAETKAKLGRKKS